MDRSNGNTRRNGHASPGRPFGRSEMDLGMIGESGRMQLLRAAIRRYAPLDEPVLVLGESGSGKELAARAIHALSRRATGPFIAVNAAAIPGSLAGSELFGHERGAFTGAHGRRRGLFEQADGGTLFLDEIADLPRDIQAWLLRVIEAGEVRALGAERVRRVDVRIVAATNVELRREAEAGRFRADLYWRLAILTVRVPPLRDRREDIALLAEHFLAAQTPSEERSLIPEGLQALLLHDWPGNVRELRAVLARAAANRDRLAIEATTIVAAIDSGSPTWESARPAANLGAALAATRGNISAAARLLGLPRSTLRDRMRAGTIARHTVN